MSASFVNSATAATSATTSHAITVPTGVVAGDLIVVVASKSITSGTWNSLAGWTRQFETAVSTLFETAMFFRIASASEVAGSTITFTTSSSSSASLALVAFSGIDASSILVGTATADDGTTTSSHSVDASAVSPSGVAVAVYFELCRFNYGTAGAPAGFTEATDVPSGGISMLSAYKIVSAGSLGTLTGTTSSSSRCLSIAAAFNEDPTGGTQFVTASGIASDETFGTPTVTPGVATVSPDAIDSAEAFGVATVTGGSGSPSLQIVSPSAIASGEAVGDPTVTGDPPIPAPAGTHGATIPVPPAAMQARWETAAHVGDIAPRMVTEVRRGRWSRGYRTVEESVENAATIPGEAAGAPWMAHWEPAEDWLEVPGVSEYSEQQSFSDNGCQIVTVTIDNVRYTHETGATSLPYRLRERGYASPTRGYVAPGRPADDLDENEWYDRLSRMAQIRVWQGYGDPERDGAGAMPVDGGTNGMWVFSGQIDDIDLSDLPDRITLTARNGQSLTDQEFFGWSKSAQLQEPVVFADRGTYEGEAQAAKWVLVDDVSEVVEVILRWAGYLDTAIETTGVSMKGHKAFNRMNFLIEPITELAELTGYSFFFAPPLDGDRMALPVFRQNGARDDAPVDMVEVTENDLLTAIEYKQSMEPLSYIVRIRGKGTTSGVPLGEDGSSRVMSVYRPPWSHQPGEPGLLADRLGGLLKHITLTRPELRTESECEVFAKLLCFYEALAEVQALIEIPGHPGLLLDSQIGVTDSTAAVNSRLWVSERSNSFTTGEQTSWKTALTGPLLDFPDVAAMLAELEDI